MKPARRWGTSSPNGLSTLLLAGYLNVLGVLESASPPLVAPGNELLFAPRVIVRDGSGVSLHAAIALPVESSVTVTVFNRAGRRVRTLAHDHRAGPGSFVVAWDGKDEGGEDSPPGLYFVRMRSSAAGSVVERTGTVAIAR